MTAQEALDWINGLKNSHDTSPVFDEYREDISRALKIAAAVDGDGLERDAAGNRAMGNHRLWWECVGNNDLLERLRGIK